MIILESMPADPHVSAKNAKEAESKWDQRLQRAFQERAKKEAKLLEPVLKAIQADAKASASLKRLVTAGCNQDFILHEIALFCGGDPGLEKRAEHARTQIRAIAARLKKDSDILWRVEWEFMADKYGPHYGPYNDVFGHTRAMTDMAQSLTVALSALSRHTHEKTIRNKHLVYLSYHIKAATGQPGYKHIARLIACMPDQPVNIKKFAESLYRRIKRQEKQDPDFFRAAKKVVQRDLGTWQLFFPQGSRSGR